MARLSSDPNLPSEYLDLLVWVQPSGLRATLELRHVRQTGEDEVESRMVDEVQIGPFSSGSELRAFAERFVTEARRLLEWPDA